MRVYEWDKLVGNFATISMLKSAIRNDSLPNFLLMTGPSGTGKSSSAEITALALTCENRLTADPCLECETCKKNLLALQDKGYSSRVKKINLGLKNDKQSINELISEVFKLETNQKTVFILEEVHSLDEGIQTSLLEEIDKLGQNVYVILCTTQAKKLLEELSNRAIKFRFSNLKSSDSRILLERVLNDYNVTLDNKVKDVILRTSKGTPRVIVSLVEFLKDNNATYNQVLDFLGEINPELFNLLLGSANDLKNFYQQVEDLVNDYSIYDVIYAFKKYLLDLQFLSKGVSTFHTNTGQSQKKLAFELGSECIYKIQTIVHSLPYKCSPADFTFAMLRIGKIVNSAKQSNKSQIVVPSVEEIDFEMESNSLQQKPSEVNASDTTSIELLKKMQGFSNNKISDVNVVTEQRTFSENNAITNHLKAEHVRDKVKLRETKTSSKLTLDKFNDILG